MKPPIKVVDQDLLPGQSATFRHVSGKPVKQFLTIGQNVEVTFFDRENLAMVLDRYGFTLNVDGGMLLQMLAGKAIEAVKGFISLDEPKTKVLTGKVTNRHNTAQRVQLLFVISDED